MPSLVLHIHAVAVGLHAAHERASELLKVVPEEWNASAKRHPSGRPLEARVATERLDIRGAPDRAALLRRRVIECATDCQPTVV